PAHALVPLRGRLEPAGPGPCGGRGAPVRVVVPDDAALVRRGRDALARARGGVRCRGRRGRHVERTPETGHGTGGVARVLHARAHTPRTPRAAVGAPRDCARVLRARRRRRARARHAALTAHGSIRGGAVRRANADARGSSRASGAGGAPLATIPGEPRAETDQERENSVADAM